ncbi:hypothetical protein ACPWT1_06035 [Ramlibacter sp. MMS24-I3-19]|uniref:hypothetical protein n=1 Tax=Ramlibacter sp. MMS24-I3-19 TaxID=3416606 RepID=UPI003CFBE25A
MADATPVRDPDPLLTPRNAVLALIDYQPEQYAGVGSVGRNDLIEHVTMLGRVATAFELPVVLSTVYVKHGMSGTNPELRDVLPGVPEIDRTSMNSWEDPDFRGAVERTQRRKLILAASGPRCASPSRPWTRCARATRCSWSRTPSAGSARSRMTAPCSG